MTKDLSNRYYSVDLIKIVSIFFIILTHFVVDIGIIHNMYNVDIIYSFLDRKNINLSMLACSLFMICSGFGLSIYYKKYFKDKLTIKNIFIFYKNRYIKILIPFYLAYIIYFIISLINVNSIHIFRPNIPKINIIWTFLGLDEYLNACKINTFSLGIGEWFLGCLLILYIAFPFIYYFNKKYKYQTFIVFIVYFLSTQLFINNFNIVPHFNVLIQVFNFYLGIFINDIFINDDKYKNNIIFILCIFLFLFIYLYNININIFYVYICTFCALLVFYIFTYFENNIKNNNILKYIINIFNKYSYEIFLCHHFVIYQINYMLHYRRINNKEFLLIFIIDLVITFLFAVSIKQILYDSIYKNINYIL